MHISPVEAAANAQIFPMDADMHTYGFPSGYFIVRNVATGRSLDVEADMVEDGTPLILYPETETSIVEDMRKPESNNQVFFIDTSGALCSRSSGHAIDVENDALVLRHRRPVSHPFPNAYSHPLPRYSFEQETGRIIVTFAADPSYSVSPDRAAAVSSWKDKTFVVSSIPMPTNAKPDDVFNSGDIDLREDEILETERSEEGEVDDSPEKVRRVKVIALSKEDERVAGEKAKARRHWDIIPLRSTRNRTGGI